MREPLKTLQREGHLASPLWPVGMRAGNRNDDSGVHSHEFIEIAIVLDGTGTHSSPLGEQQIGAGDAFILRPGAWHAYHDCHDLKLVNFLFGIEFLERELSFAVHNPLVYYLFWAGPLSRSRKGILSLHLNPNLRARCLGHIDVCTELQERQDPQAHLKWLAHFLLVLECLIESLDNHEPCAEPDNSHIHPAVRAGIQLLETRPTYNWTLSELSEQLHFNPSYLTRLFKKSVGLAPLRYLARYRAEQAARLLLSSDLNIADIGAQVGWPNPSYFGQRFKAHFGLSAGEYRSRFAAANSAHDIPAI